MLDDDEEDMISPESLRHERGATRPRCGGGGRLTGDSALPWLAAHRTQDTSEVPPGSGVGAVAWLTGDSALTWLAPL